MGRRTIFGERSGRELIIWTGLGLSVDVGGSIGNVSAVEMIDIPAGELKTDVSLPIDG